MQQDLTVMTDAEFAQIYARAQDNRAPDDPRLQLLEAENKRREILLKKDGFRFNARNDIHQ